ncbi:MAG: J domain-containing protein [Myxococcales bacterium]|nr:J domain-containing protein [Myxococcales bacterium]
MAPVGAPRKVRNFGTLGLSAPFICREVRMRFDRALVNVDLYAVLKVPRHATPEQIRRAHRRLASISHPDLNPHDMSRAERRMAQINVAAGVLMDPARRAAYDRMRADRDDGREPGGRGVPHAPPIDVSSVRLDPRDLEWIDRLRSWPSRLSAQFDQWTESWSPEFRMMFLFASVALALGLIRSARPTSLPSPFEEARPAATAAAKTSPT